MNIVELLKKFKIEPNDLGLYYEALTHKSFVNEKRTKGHYQRLEFLGDAILDFVTSDFMYKNFKKMNEGEMSIIRANAVNGNQLAEFTRELGLDSLIRFGNNKTDFNDNSKILADVFEAFVAAIYLDKGMESVIQFLRPNLLEFIRKSDGKEVKNPKTILQEYLQLESRGTIKYEVSEKNGKFTADVFHDNSRFGRGEGSTKKEAEVKAAENALKLLGTEKNEIN